MPSFLGRQRFQTSAIAVIFSGEASDIPRNPFPQEVKYGIQKFCQRTRHIFLCGSPMPVSGRLKFCGGRRSVPAHQLYLHHCSAGLCLRQLCAEPCQRGSAPETAQHHRTAAVLQCCGGAAVSRAGADAVPGESRRIAGTLVSLVQAAGCAVFAALQPLQHGCDHFVPLLGKNHFSGALESAACGGGVGNLCPCPERIPAGETAV